MLDGIGMDGRERVVGNQLRMKRAIKGVKKRHPAK